MRQQTLVLAIFSFMVIMLSSCGQKGALFIPVDAPKQQVHKYDPNHSPMCGIVHHNHSLEDEQ
jgi:predicted small lipoprotein YifL